MSGVTPLIDTLLATRLAQRVDLVPLKGQTDIAGPNAVVQVAEVANDIRQASRAALQQQLGVALSRYGGSDIMSPPTGPSGGLTLSAVASAINEVLDLASGAASSVQGGEPLWPNLQPPVAQQLAPTLAHAVGGSGLFYESHLLQYANGTRTLAQVTQEPQALLSEGRASPLAAEKGQSEAAASGATPFGAVAVIHPDAISLVRQQLELLAVPTFRWAGEAWPGTPMKWEIHEEANDPQSTTENVPAQRAWATRLVLTLPELGVVEVRLSIAGTSLQLCLAAKEDTTVDLISDGSQELRQRYGGHGLQLKTLQVETLAVESAAKYSWKLDDAV